MRTKEISPGARPRPKLLNDESVVRRPLPRKPKEQHISEEADEDEDNEEYDPDKKRKDKRCRGKMINIVA
jgi:hypothetical protein